VSITFKMLGETSPPLKNSCGLAKVKQKTAKKSGLNQVQRGGSAREWGRGGVQQGVKKGMGGESKSVMTSQTV